MGVACDVSEWVVGAEVGWVRLPAWKRALSGSVFCAPPSRKQPGLELCSTRPRIHRNFETFLAAHMPLLHQVNFSFFNIFYYLLYICHVYFYSLCLLAGIIERF